MSVFKAPATVPALFIFGLVSILSSCARPAVLIHTTHDIGMANAERVSRLGSSGHSKDIAALCSGDLDKILAVSSLNKEQKSQVHSLICGGTDSTKAFRDFYYALPDVSRIDLANAFALYGYHIRGFS